MHFSSRRLARGLIPLGVAGLLVGSASTSHAQMEIPGTPYTGFVTEQPYVELTNATQLLGGQSSSQSTSFTLPFAFKYYDRSTSELSVGDSGCISFLPGLRISTSNLTPGQPASFNDVDGWLAPWWDSMRFHTAQGGNLGYEIRGEAPNRVVILQWQNLNHNYSASGTPELFNFQVRLHEGLSGRIDVHYGPGPTSASFVSATMGMEDQDGMRGINFGTCGANCQPADFNALTDRMITLVQDPGVELVALNVTAPQFATLGLPLDIPVALANLNRNSVGPFNVDVVVSRTRDLANPIVIGSQSIALAPYQTSSANVRVTPPVSLGEQRYYLGLIVDTTNVVAEVAENNNTAVSRSAVRFLPSRPDLAVTKVRLSSRSIRAGSTVDLYATVTNAGSEPAAATPITAMLSSNPSISAQDGRLASANVTLAAGQTVTTTITVTIPADTNSGSYYLGALADPDAALTEINESNNGRAADQPISVAGGNLAILTTALPMATVQETYVGLLSAAGGDSPYMWEITQGTLPRGLGVVAATGELFGRPTMTESQTFTVQVTSGMEKATQQLTLSVTKPSEPLTIVTRDLPDGVAGQEYSFQLVATGGANTSSVTWTATGLPDGFQLTSTGILAGSSAMATETPVAISVQATNGTQNAMRDLTLTILANGTLQITPTPMPTARYNEPYTHKFTSSGGIEPITFLVQFGRLPEGLDLAPDGELSGTPTEVGTFRIVIEARDSVAGGRAAKDVNTFELVVSDGAGFQITTAALADATVDEEYNRAIAAAGGLAPYEWKIEKGLLPMGLVAASDDNTNEFRIKGQTSEEGVFNLLISATDAQGRRAVKALALRVAKKVVVVEKPKDDGGCTAVKTGGSASGALLGMAVLGLLGVALRRRRD